MIHTQIALLVALRVSEITVLFQTRSWVGLHHVYVYEPYRCMELEFRFPDYQQYFCLPDASSTVSSPSGDSSFWYIFTRGDGRCPFYAVQHHITLSRIPISSISPQPE